jgi:hypothetical protein
MTTLDFKYRVGLNRVLTPTEVDGNFHKIEAALLKVEIPSDAQAGDVVTVGADGSLEVVSLAALTTYLTELGYVFT